MIETNYKSIPKFFLLALMLSMFFARSAKASTIDMPTNFLSINTGLVGWWSMDGGRLIPNVIDSSGNGNNGRLLNQTPTTTTVGKIGQALVFDGVDDYVDVGSSASLQLTSAGTIAMWVKYPAQNDFAILTGNEDFFDDLSGYVLGICRPGCTSSSDYSIFLELATPSIHSSIITPLGYADNNWHYVVSTWNSIGNGNIYIDGVNVKSGTLGNTATANANIDLGREAVNGIYQYHGAMDDVRLYNRELSASEALALYHANSGKRDISRPLSTLKNGLLNYWTFDGPNLLTDVADSSGQGHDGFLNGGATTTIPGKIGQALSFNGASYVDSSNFADNLANFSVSFWFKDTTTYDANCVAMVSKLGTGGIGSGTGWAIGMGGSGCGLSANQVFAMIQTDGSDWSTKFNSVPMNDNKWHHAVQVVTGGNTVTFYLDGSTANSGSTSGGTVGSYSNPFNVRVANDSSNELFSGSIDDVRIYNRPLSSGEVSQLYIQGR